MRSIPRVAAIALALFGAALLVRLYRLDAQSLWLDEGSSWQIAQLPWAALLADLLRPSAAYPLYHLLLKGWVLIFGASEFALRLPSALAGAGAVAAIYLAGVELWGARGQGGGDPQQRLALPAGGQGGRAPRSASVASGPVPPALAAALIALASPFTIWYAQEAKVYSLLLLCAALLVWLFLRALRLGRRGDWLALAGAALLAVSVHRLAALLVLGLGWAWVAASGSRAREQGDKGASGQGDKGWGSGEVGEGQGSLPFVFPLFPASVLLALASLSLVALMAGGLGSDRAATGAYIAADPLTALGLTFVRFSLDRWPGDAPWWWWLPWAALLGWGLARLIADRRSPAARALLALLVAPLALFAIQLAFTRLYEARYLIASFPAWALALAYPLAGGRGQGDKGAGGQGDKGQGFLLTRIRGGFTWDRGRPARSGPGGPDARAPGTALVGLALITGVLALFQPTFGIFSGAPVKEQYRETIAELAARAHPDDAVVLHPGYIRPLYDYYMGRMSADPAPAPISFADFWQGETSYGQREWDTERRAKLAGYTRSWLLIAPEHARTVDVPLPGDEYGLVGNFWAFSREQRAWPCGIWRNNGAHLLCQEAPEAYITGAAPRPATPGDAVFGGNLRLLGFTLKATTPAGPGVYRAGGNLPVSLFWDMDVPPPADYSMFLHLCQDCESPPAAGDDGPPLEGYLPTSTWLPGSPARDDRAIALPADLPPGRYTLLLGVYRPDDPSPNARLTVVGAGAVGDGRLVLGEIEIVAP